jgi:hypothetical protein
MNINVIAEFINKRKKNSISGLMSQIEQCVPELKVSNQLTLNDVKEMDINQFMEHLEQEHRITTNRYVTPN